MIFWQNIPCPKQELTNLAFKEKCIIENPFIPRSYNQYVLFDKMLSLLTIILNNRNSELHTHKHWLDLLYIKWNQPMYKA